MSKRWWLLGLGGLILSGLLLACGSNFNPSQDGLLLVGSQGSGLIETFSFTLSNGHVSAIANTPANTSAETCVLQGQPTSIVMDPAGVYAYAILIGSGCPSGQTGIVVFKVASDGNISQVGNLVSFAVPTIVIQGQAPPNTEAIPVVPYSMSIDAAGKFLFVADRATTDSASRLVPGAVSVFSIGSGGTVAEVAGSPFFTSSPAMTLSQPSIDIVSVAATPTVFPGTGINGTQNSVCQTPGSTPPTLEFLYAVDDVGYQLFEFQVDTSSGVLTAPPSHTAPVQLATDEIPLGIAVDPCDRFAYVSGSKNNRISGYTICSTVIPSSCPVADGTLQPIAGSPFTLTGSANGPGPIAVDPNGNNVYVVGTLSNTVSPLKITPVSGALTALNPATVATGAGPVSIVIRGDDNWMFVANHGSASQGGSSVSQYSITPATGALTAAAPIQTDNYPFGVAVK